MENYAIDLSKLEAMAGGDEVFIAKMIEMFGESIDEGLQKFPELKNAGDLYQYGRLAHKMKPSIDTMCTPYMSQLIRSNEKIEESGTKDDLFNDLITAFKAIRENIKAMAAG